MGVNSGAASIWIKRSDNNGSVAGTFSGMLPVCLFFCLFVCSFVGWLIICHHLVAPVVHGGRGFACAQSFLCILSANGIYFSPCCSPVCIQPGFPVCLAEILRAKRVPTSLSTVGPLSKNVSTDFPAPQRAGGVLSGPNPLISWKPSQHPNQALC